MKQRVKEGSGINWIVNLDGCSKQDAIAWLEDNIADMAILEVDYGWEGIDGSSTYIMREETDEEEAAREAKEAAIEAERLQRKRLTDETHEARMERLQYEDKMLYDYLEKHKGNPHIGDLENLFKSLLSLRNQGVQEDSDVVQSLIECKERLEGGYE